MVTSGPPPALNSPPVPAAQQPPDSGQLPDSPQRGRFRTSLDAVRANPTGRIALKILIALVGALVVAIGIALIPLPGPGWLIVLAGLGIWAVEFAWAKHLLHFTRGKLRLWTRWIGRQTWPVRLAIGAIGLIFITVVVGLSVKYSLGIDLWAKLGTYVTTH
jgi:uncharacterized protein (TIGR02611 family)